MYVNNTQFFKRQSLPSEALFKLLHTFHNTYAVSIDLSLYFVLWHFAPKQQDGFYEGIQFILLSLSCAFIFTLVKILDGAQKQVMIYVIPIYTNL